ncbi:rod shape-determining protein [Catenisphaera adipataccumulans]|jgi:rod shape-determining protein MreB|uniref:Rod shape-determining protein MreB n=1 Tax=Catenisphaera adipataccumulans TaxID=700500 RepID=A0A7W8CXG0_9FIRM|nr:rod shape-determining protein [Catenisphaera adipataccumulans]MBB5183388.1 rod shape-determining protein MreB [Catenisphaera adipataccumulans]
MFNHRYALDPGSFMCRFYDYETEAETAVRTCTASENGKVIAVGQEALNYLYRPDDQIQVHYPIDHVQILSSIVPVIHAGLDELGAFDTLFTADLVVTVPDDMQESFQEEWQRELLDVGIHSVRFMPLHTGWHDERPTLHVHSGHSFTQIGIYAEDRIYAEKTIFFAGRQIDENIIAAVRKNGYSILPEDARALREAASDAFWRHRNPTLICNAYAQTGWIRLRIKAETLWPCLKNVFDQITLWTKQALEQVDVEVKESVHQNQIQLSGGLGNCFGLKQSLAFALNIPVVCADKPEKVVIDQMKGWR